MSNNYEALHFKLKIGSFYFYVRLITFRSFSITIINSPQFYLLTVNYTLLLLKKGHRQCHIIHKFD